LTAPESNAAQCSPVPAQAGIGLRFPHHEHVLGARPAVAWFEVHAENYFGGGRARRTLEAVRGDYPVALHGVGLSLGSAEGLDGAHLQRLAALAAAIEPGLISEHLSWSVTGGRYLADLLPLPMTEEALEVVCRHVEQAQQALGRQLLLENPSSYLQFPHSSIPEWEFLAAVAARTGCGLLCDINNIFVSASNHGWDAGHYLEALPGAAIGEYHLAGHTECVLADGRQVRIDTHGAHVAPAVWALYEQALRRFGARPTLIEWDTNLPAFEVLQDEAAQAAARLQSLAGAGRARAA
jgi:uncharacterized protein (UPF0276 family)